MRTKILLYSGSVFIVILAAGILIIPSLIERHENQKIFDKIRAIDYRNSEKQVVEKITGLIERTEENPDSAECWGKLGENLYIHDHKDLSVDCFTKACQLDDGDFRWSYFCGVALDDLNSDRAIEWYEKSRKIKPVYPPLNIKLGNRYLLKGDRSRAEENFEAVIEAGMRVPHAYLGLAKIAMEKNDLKEAEDQLHNAVKMAPTYREARAVLADVYRRQGEREKAEKIFSSLGGLPDRLDLSDPVYFEMVEEGVSSFWCQVRGNIYLKRNDLNNAEEEFKKALEAKPNEASHTSLGYVYQRQKRYEAAIDHYNQALALNPEYSSALNNLAVVYYDLGDVQKARSIMKKVLETDSGSVDACLNMGTFSKEMGNRKEAVKYFREGLEKAPADRRFVYQLGWLLAAAPESDIRDAKQALRYAEMICEDSGYNSPASLDLLAAALAEDGQFKKAAKTAGQACDLAVQSKDNKLAAEIRSREKLYEANRAYREK